MEVARDKMNTVKSEKDSVSLIFAFLAFSLRRKILIRND